MRRAKSDRTWYGVARLPYTTRLASRPARWRTGWNATATTAAATAASSGRPRLPASVPTPTTRPAYTAVMNTASEPYRTALLITMSISYSRYFSTAMPMAAYRHRNARSWTMFAARAFVTIVGIVAATRSRAAAANHFSCSRSSPDDRANRTTTVTTLITYVRGSRIRIAASTHGYSPSWNGWSGCAQIRLARTIKTTPVAVYTPATNHAAGRHRRERSRPSGNSMSRKASSALSTTKIQLFSQAAAR